MNSAKNRYGNAVTCKAILTKKPCNTDKVVMETLSCVRLLTQIPYNTHNNAFKTPSHAKMFGLDTFQKQERQLARLCKFQIIIIIFISLEFYCFRIKDERKKFYTAGLNNRAGSPLLTITKCSGMIEIFPWKNFNTNKT